MTEKQQMMSERVGNWWRRFERCILNAKIGWSSNKFKKHWSARVTDEFSSENPDTPKEIVQFVHEVRPVFAVTLSTLLHMLCGRNDDTMPSSNIFSVDFVVIFNFNVIISLNESVNDWKTANDVRTCWKLMTSLWMVCTECKNRLEL